MLQDKADWICRNYDRLKGERGTWESHWQEIVDYTLPRKDQITIRTTPGEKKAQKIYDTTAPHALEILASGLHTMLTNPSILWFGLQTGITEIDKRDDVRKWLQECVTVINNTLNKTNFQDQIHEVYFDLGSIGTALLVIEEDEETDVNFISVQVSQALLSESRKKKVDTVYRCVEYTSSQLLEIYGEQAFDANTNDVLRKDSMRKWEVIHAVFKNDNYNPFSKSLKNKPFVSAHVLKDTKRVIKEGGFDVFPYAAPRWTKESNEIYGRSPAMKALPDTKLLNEIKRTVIVAKQKTIDPPLQAPDEGVVLPLKISPGAINYYRAGTKDRIEPLFTGLDSQSADVFMEQIRNQIREAFFVDQLQLNEGPQMTATEVMQRTEEKLRVMGPILGRLHNELLKPIIDRVFDILAKRGKLPPNMPEVLKGRDLDVQYASMISRSQKASEADNINRVFGMMAPMIQLDPNVLDNFNLDAMARHFARLFNVPQEIMTNQDELEKSRQAKAEMAQQQMAAQQEAQDVDNISKLKQG